VRAVVGGFARRARVTAFGNDSPTIFLSFLISPSSRAIPIFPINCRSRKFLHFAPAFAPAPTARAFSVSTTWDDRWTIANIDNRGCCFSSAQKSNLGNNKKTHTGSNLGSLSPHCLGANAQFVLQKCSSLEMQCPMRATISTCQPVSNQRARTNKFPGTGEAIMPVILQESAKPDARFDRFRAVKR
jgi:hypothetical protein